MAEVPYAALAEEYPSATRPWLDRDEVDEAALTEDQRAWRRDGVLIKRGLLPPDVVGAYTRFRARAHAPGGWRDPCPYLRHDELKAIALHAPMVDVMESLIGHPTGLHLTLTGWISTDRRWHSDDYLNPEFVHAHYIAVWIALERIDPESGPFQFVRGSHRWPPLRRHRLFAMIPPDVQRTAEWPHSTEGIVAVACEREIARRGAAIETFLGGPGDVLFWHGRLVHQGSRARVPGLPRRALIAHYSSLNHRPDMPRREIYPPTGKTYFDFPEWRGREHDEGVIA
jgi:Phytanoyl-CoA dioxygenase (PhyH)